MGFILRGGSPYCLSEVAQVNRPSRAGWSPPEATQTCAQADAGTARGARGPELQVRWGGGARSRQSHADDAGCPERSARSSPGRSARSDTEHPRLTPRQASQVREAIASIETLVEWASPPSGKAKSKNEEVKVTSSSSLPRTLRLAARLQEQDGVGDAIGANASGSCVS